MIGLLPLWGLVLSLAPLLAGMYLLVRGLQLGEYERSSYRAFKLVNAFMGLVFACIGASALLR